MAASSTKTFLVRADPGGSELVKLAPGSVFMLGSDARNDVQMSHGSIAPFHARLRCDDWGAWITPLCGARVLVAGEKTTEERLIPLQGRLEIGELGFALEVQEEPTPARSIGSRLRDALLQAGAIVLSVGLHGGVLWGVSRLALPMPAIEPERPPFRLGIATRQGERDGEEWAHAPIDPRDASLPETPAETPFGGNEAIAAEGGDPTLTTLPKSSGGSGEGGHSNEASLWPVEDLGSLAGIDHIGVGASFGRTSGLSGGGSLSLDDYGGSGRGGRTQALVTRLKALRGSGVDLVFVIDTTSSMRPFLDGARMAADALVSKLTLLVEDLRVGVVVYRDHGDEFLTRILPLSDERYSILNFLWGLVAEGGGDLPEAVVDGLDVAIHGAGWRQGTHRVIVIVGDAPPHVQDWPKLKKLAKEFARGESVPGAVISAVYTGLPREEAKDPEEDGAAALGELARLGRGDYVDLGDVENVGERLLQLLVGPKHQKELTSLLAQARDGPREEVIRRHVAAGNRAWLLDRLSRPPIHPAVVNALVDLADQKVLWAARKLVADATAARESREAALYILRRCLPPAGMLDLDRTFAQQQGIFNQVDALILRR